MIRRNIIPWLATLFLTCTLGVGTAPGQQEDTDKSKKPAEEIRMPVAEAFTAVIATALVLLVVCKPTGKVAG